MKIVYKDKEITCREGVITPDNQNREAWKVLSDFLYTLYGYELTGGSFEGYRVYLGVKIQGSGQNELAQHLKKIFGFSDLVLNGQQY